MCTRDAEAEAEAETEADGSGSLSMEAKTFFCRVHATLHLAMLVGR